VNRLQKLLLPVLAAVMLVVPSAASAASIETQSSPNRGNLTIDVHKIGPSQYKWNQLHYRLASCGSGQADGGTSCHWALWGRISPSYAHCPEHEVERPEGTVLTFFHRYGNYGNPSLSTGTGHVILPEGWSSTGRQVICWYTQIEDGASLTLTAHTVIKH
jgi:hypothetical protein